MVRAALIAAAVALLALAQPAAAQDRLPLANLGVRTGPFAAGGVAMMNGQRDYMLMLNERDGGVNGLLLGYEECETGYNAERGLACYETARAQGGIVVQPGSTELALRVLPRTHADRVPVLAPGYGPSVVADGRTFRWAFSPPATTWDGASMIIDAISGGDPASLRGRKIVLLHLDAPFGHEPLPLLRALAATHGFTVVPIPVGVRGMQNQSAQWQQIEREAPDFVLLWGWGAMNAAALAEAVQAGFPMDRLVGIWWSGHDGDLLAVGEAAKGYRALSFNLPVADSEAIRDIRTHVVDRGQSMAGEGELAQVSYQRGVLISMFLVEAIRAAQEHFDTRALDAGQLRWGLENLAIGEARLAELGMSGMIAPFSTSCSDHSGHAGAWMLRWDGAAFVAASGLLKADQAAIAPVMAAEAAAFAAANQPWQLNEGCAG